VKPTCAYLSTPAQYYPPGWILRLSDERDLWYDRVLAAERAGYARGYADGERDGYERGTRQLETDWPAMAAGLGGLTHTALEWRRWGPGGRERFGDPRPGDFPGLQS
jgi:hypothetical protein